MRRALALGLGLALATQSGCYDEIVEPLEPGVPPEVRGLRLIPGDGAVTVHFLDTPKAESYTACVADRLDGVERGRCDEGVSSPHRIEGLRNGERIWVAILAENLRGTSPVVEIPSAVPGPAKRPMSVHLELSEDVLEELYSRSVRSDARLPAELALGHDRAPDEWVDAVRGLRFRGHSTRTQPRKSYHLRLDERPVLEGFPDFNFRSAERRAGNRLLLNQTWSDPTGIRPALAFAMYDELDLPAPDTFFADLWLNGVYEGHFIGIERVDREALRGWGLERDHGRFTLVRDRSRQSRRVEGASAFAVDPSSLGETDDEIAAVLEQIFDARGNDEEQNWLELVELLRWVHTPRRRGRRGRLGSSSASTSTTLST